MITTGCEECCFLKRDDKGKWCSLKQVCALKNGKAFTHGYCRLCRSHKWAKKHGNTDLQLLHKQVVTERSLKFDMLVFFDEARNKVADLEHTLNSDWYISYAQKIIIMDVTGFGKRQNFALQYLKSRKHEVPVIVDSSVEPESVHQRGQTIHRLSSKVTAPFFLVIPAGNKLSNFNLFAKMIQFVPSRVIHWSFPFTVAATAVVPNNLDYGLFITAPYRALMKSSDTDQSFTQLLKKEELETEMGLSWFCTDVWLR